MTNARSMSRNAQRVLLLAPAFVIVAAMAMNVKGGAEPEPFQELPAPEPLAAPVAFSNPAIADPLLTSSLDDAEALRRALAEEDAQLQWEAEERARAEAELAQLEAERVRLEQQILGGDPSLLPILQTSSEAGGGASNIEFCNASSTEVRVAMVRSNGTFAALTRDSWIADGFYTLAPSECTSRRFGWAQGLANGYVSIFRKSGERWVAVDTRDEGGDEGGATFQAHQRSICWPQAATSVDPDYSCPDSPNNIAFTHWFGTSGNVYRFRITITDTAIEKFARYRA